MAVKYFVADTNIIVSAAVFSSFNPALSLKKMMSLGTLVFSDVVLNEYTETLSSSKFDKFLPLEKRLQFIGKLVVAGTLITITESIKACRDPKDDKYLELAVSCKATCIITGDKDLLVLHPFENIPILTASEFLAAY